MFEDYQRKTFFSSNLLLFPFVTEVKRVKNSPWCHFCVLDTTSPHNGAFVLVRNYWPESRAGLFVILFFVCSLCLFVCWERFLLYSSGWPSTHYVAQTGLKLPSILLPQLPRRWDNKCAPPQPAWFLRVKEPEKTLRNSTPSKYANIMSSFFFSAVLKFEPRMSCLLGKCSTTSLHPKSSLAGFFPLILVVEIDDSITKKLSHTVDLLKLGL